MSLETDISLEVLANLTNALDLVTASARHNFKKKISISDANADNVFSDTRTIAGSGSDDLDLAGSLVNAIGTTLTFTAIKAIIIVANADNGGNIAVGGAASNTFINWVGDATDTIIIRPGGLFVLACNDATGYAVTADTGDILHIVNQDSSDVDYDIIIIGETS